MKRTGSGKRNSKSSATSIKAETRFAICVRNTGYPASLELRKLYVLIPDSDAEETGMVRVIDESEEDYLYPSSFFAAVELPKALEKAVLKASA